MSLAPIEVIALAFGLTALTIALFFMFFVRPR